MIKIRSGNQYKKQDLNPGYLLNDIDNAIQSQFGKSPYKVICPIIISTFNPVKEHVRYQVRDLVYKHVFDLEV